ncbi:MAG: chemotaxis protein, partial [Thalassolituus maritimus]
MSGNTVNQGKKSNFSAIVLMFVFLIGFIGITIGVNILATKDEQYLEHSGELRVLSQELAKNAVEAAGGKPDAFTQLRQARDN